MMTELTTPIAQVKRGNVKAVASVRGTVIRRGAFQLCVSAYNVTGAALGQRQQRTAADLKLEVTGQITSTLYADGWHTEQIVWAGQPVILWWPPVSS
jgi:hypothetical protein